MTILERNKRTINHMYPSTHACEGIWHRHESNQRVIERELNELLRLKSALGSVIQRCNIKIGELCPY